MRGFARSDEHEWAQRHLSHYAEGDLRSRARRRLERHAADCPDCRRGIRAMKALLRLITGLDERAAEVHAPDGMLDRVRAEANNRPAKPLRGPQG